jgi:hypothetical protein
MMIDASIHTNAHTKGPDMKLLDEFPRRIVDASDSEMVEAPIKTYTEAWELDTTDHALVGITTTTRTTEGRVLSETTVTASNWGDLK